MTADTFERDLAWARRHMPLTRAQVEALEGVRGLQLACSVHLDLKMVVAFEGLLERGVSLFLTTCNPQTVRDEVVDYLSARGADAYAWNGMTAANQEEAARRALAWAPTALCEMGADLSAAIVAARTSTTVRAGLEATGSGISRLAHLARQGQAPPYPIFNWDDLPIKEGLHNRHLVGLSTWQAFSARTQLSLHGLRVLVVGYGLVGQGVAATARAFGGTVSIAERDPARALEARYAGWETGDLSSLLPRADIVVTATGRAGVLNAEGIRLLKDGCFVLNVGHTADEIEVAALGPRKELIPFVEEAVVDGRRVYLFAGGSMANLTAGSGDSLNTFDVTLATMVAGIGFVASPVAQQAGSGVHPLPRAVWEAVARRASDHAHD